MVTGCSMCSTAADPPGTFVQAVSVGCCDCQPGNTSGTYPRMDHTLQGPLAGAGRPLSHCSTTPGWPLQPQVGHSDILHHVRCEGQTAEAWLVHCSGCQKHMFHELSDLCSMHAESCLASMQGGQTTVQAAPPASHRRKRKPKHSTCASAACPVGHRSLPGMPGRP